MALLNTVLVGDAMGVFITKTYSTLYPHGIACLVWKGLRKQYQPDGINLTLDFSKELQEVSMARFDDPNCGKKAKIVHKKWLRQVPLPKPIE
jgi:hypothetical protein